MKLKPETERSLLKEILGFQMTVSWNSKLAILPMFQEAAPLSIENISMAIIHGVEEEISRLPN